MDERKDHGFRPIGSLLPTSLPSPKASGSTAGQPPTTSGIIGFPDRAAHSSSTGMRPSMSGAERKLAEQAATANSDRESKAALTALLEAYFGRRPAEVSSSTYGPDGQYEPRLEEIRLPRPAGMTDSVWRAQARAVWMLLEPLCRPAREDAGAMRRILEEWGRMRAVTISRAESANDADLATDTVLDELEKYPADCVIRALVAWRNGHKWRPSLSEILAEVQWRSRYRRCLKAAFVQAGVA